MLFAQYSFSQRQRLSIDLFSVVSLTFQAIRQAYRFHTTQRLFMLSTEYLLYHFHRFFRQRCCFNDIAFSSRISGGIEQQ